MYLRMYVITFNVSFVINFVVREEQVALPEDQFEQFPCERGAGSRYSSRGTQRIYVYIVQNRKVRYKKYTRSI